MSKLATIRIDGELRAARLEKDDTLSVLAAPDVGALIRSESNLGEAKQGPVGREVPLADADFAPVVPAPEKIFCIGLNYSDHAGEANRELPDYPQIFAKYSRALIGAHDEVMMPAVSDRVDWEAELGIVIGSPARYVAVADALDHVAGYTVANDVSVRDWQRRTPQFLQGKTFEHMTPVGPFLVTPDEVDVADLRIVCKVDGEVVQDFSTAQMVFPPAYLVSYISQIITLEPGDLILTGTGSGVGVARKPPRFISPGSTLATTIEGLGAQENVCVSDGGDGSKVPAARTAG